MTASKLLQYCSRAATIRAPPLPPPHERGGGESDSDEDTWYQVERDCDWHFSYDRRLSCSSKAVSGLAFSPDGQWLLSASGSGDARVWDAARWEQEETLRAGRMEDFTALAFSPARRWLVCVQPSALYVYRCGSPWSLVQVLTAGDLSAEGCGSEEARCEQEALPDWSCAMFAPGGDDQDVSGRAGQQDSSCCCAVVRTGHLFLLNYAGGWSAGMPRRTHSLLRNVRPTCIAYSSGGESLLIGFESGLVQVWDATMLSLERTLDAHRGRVNCLTALPRCEEFEKSFLASCGADGKIRLWDEDQWVATHAAEDRRANAALAASSPASLAGVAEGVRACIASPDGLWLLSLAAELCIWRIGIWARKGKKRRSERDLFLQLHQRLEVTSSASVLLCAGLSPDSSAIAVGSMDGVLGVFARSPGPVPAEGLPCPPSLLAEARATPVSVLAVHAAGETPCLLRGGGALHRRSGDRKLSKVQETSKELLLLKSRLSAEPAEAYSEPETPSLSPSARPKAAQLVVMPQRPFQRGCRSRPTSAVMLAAHTAAPTRASARPPERAATMASPSWNARNYSINEIPALRRAISKPESACQAAAAAGAGAPAEIERAPAMNNVKAARRPATASSESRERQATGGQEESAGFARTWHVGAIAEATSRTTAEPQELGGHASGGGRLSNTSSRPTTPTNLRRASWETPPSPSLLQPGALGARGLASSGSAPVLRRLVSAPAEGTGATRLRPAASCIKRPPALLSRQLPPGGLRLL
eukprot:TRINITY_DN91959_c0_g1_i1.p1 TRINITY_DN91959_c0_g1~~TRINITY_DN91959_c0_g1_i1.p1  ORF type:complete len:760 (+),score=136.78 TRINITY_DN91959_c0_g1_i1:173-2452(+)